MRVPCEPRLKTPVHANEIAAVCFSRDDSVYPGPLHVYQICARAEQRKGSVKSIRCAIHDRFVVHRPSLNSFKIAFKAVPILSRIRMEFGDARFSS